MEKAKETIKKILPKWALSFYHFLLSTLAGIIYRHPADSMIVIGITGTKGKTSTTNFLMSILSAAGIKAGLIGTTYFITGKREIPNTLHMTMPGRFLLQKYLAEMRSSKCGVAIIETTSEGLKQWRHIGINYDIALFTNLYPEHLTSHDGSFEKYKLAKSKLFSALSKAKKKKINGKIIQKTIIANIDDPHAEFFLSFASDKKITFGMSALADFRVSNIEPQEQGYGFLLNDEERYEIKIPGEFNVINAAGAIVIAKSIGVNNDLIKLGLSKIEVIPGRMEEISEGQKFRLFIDYAHQKESMFALLSAGIKMKKPESKIIVILGAEGGGRDKNKRFNMGSVVGKLADFVIISNTDPYDDDPDEIAEDIASSARAEGKKDNINLFKLTDRHVGIEKAFAIAKENDIVFITGKGAEHTMIYKGKALPWDERKIVRQKIKEFLKK